MPVRNLRDGTIVLADAGGTGGSNKVTVDLEDGGLTWSQKTPVSIIKDRGVLDHARLADEEPVDISLTMKFQTLTTHVSPSPYDLLTKTGGASAFTSDEPDSDVWAIIIEITIVDPAGGASETLTFTRVCVEEISFAEGDEFDTLSFSGRCVETAPSAT